MPDYDSSAKERFVGQALLGPALTVSPGSGIPYVFFEGVSGQRLADVKLGGTKESRQPAPGSRNSFTLAAQFCYGVSVAERARPTHRFSDCSDARRAGEPTCHFLIRLQ
jgi:hypothetical protein